MAVCTPLSPSALRTLQLSPFSDVMEYLSAVMPSPLGRLVAKKISALRLTTPIELGPAEGTARGHYLFDRVRGVDKIIIDPERAGLDTVLHEGVHAATVAALRNPRTEAERAAVKVLNELYQQAVVALPDWNIKNVEEFVAEAWSNAEFQRELHRVPLQGESKYGPKTLWDAFKQAVMQVLGLMKSSALSETLLASSDVMTNRKVQSNLKLDQQAQKAAAPSTAFVGVKNGARTWIAYAKGDTYTLYPTTAQEPRGVAGAGITGLSRTQVEQRIRAAGNEVLPPVADGRSTPGTPQASSTKLVGFAPSGNLQVVAFEQKDGSWTYYESTTDVRTDPNATVYKGLTKDQAQRYLSQKGMQPVAPKPGAVKPAGASPSKIGYDAPKSWVVTWANAKEALIAIGRSQAEQGVSEDQRVDIASVLMNSNASQKIDAVFKQYVDPARRAGAQVSKDFNKTQEQIEETLRNLHLIERANVKIRQLQRGNLEATELQPKLQKQYDDIKNAEKYLRDLSNPEYVGAIKDGVAPLFKALSDNTIDMAAQYHLISREAAENIKRAYDYYVPFQTAERTTTGKAATGTASTGDLSFVRLQEQAYRTIARGEQNALLDKVVRIAETGGLVNNADQTKNVVEVGGKVVMRYDPETNSLNSGVDNRVFDENTITLYRENEEGKVVRIPVTITEDSLLQALGPYKGVQRKTAITALIALSSAVTRTIAVGKTALSPAFSPFNLVRDIGTAFVNLNPRISKVALAKEIMNPTTYGAAFYNVFKDAFGGEMSGKFGEAKKAGAFVEQRAYIGLDELVRSADTAFNPTRKQQFKKAGSRLFKIAVAFSQAIESATRYAVYKAAKESGMEDREAAMAGKTTTVNFENRGLKSVSPFYIFANAKLQSARALTQSAKEAGAAKASLFATGMVALGLTAAFIGYRSSDKDKDGKSKYLKIPDFRKDSMVVFKENGLGVPLPQEIASFYIIGNAIGDGVWGNKPWGAVTSRIFTGILNSFYPGNVPQSDVTGHKARPVEFMLRAMTPSPAMPFVDFATNRNTWGSDIVPNLEDKRKLGIPNYAMGSGKESELAVNAKKTLQSIGFSPDAARLTLNPAEAVYKMSGGYVDVAPQQLNYLNNYLNPLAEGAAFWRDMLGARDVRYQGDIVNPLERKFTGKASGFYDQDQFDELLSKTTQAKYMAEHNGIAALSPEEQALARSADMMNRIQSDIKGYFKNYKLMSKEQLQRMEDLKSKRMLEGIRRYNELRDRSAR